MCELTQWNLDCEHYWIRASGDCLCPVCLREYWRHPLDKDSPFLHVTCCGLLVKT